MKVSFISCCFIILLASCGGDKDVTDKVLSQADSDLSESLIIDLLVFKSEGILEVWQKSKVGTFKYMNKVPLKNSSNLPIGIFEWKLKDETHLVLEFPSLIYRQKLAITNFSNQKDFQQIDFQNELSEKDFHYLQSILKNGSSGRFLIFPNKPAPNKHFKAMMNAPHWIAELYVMLELELKNYPLTYGD